MTQKLLNKTLRIYIVFSVIVLVITAPLFFILTQYVQLVEADEILLLRKLEFEKYNLKTLKTIDLEKWNLWNRDTRIEMKDFATRDNQFSNEFYPNIMDGDEEPYRILRSPIIIEGHPYLLFQRINMIGSEDTMYSLLALFVTILLLMLVSLFIITGKYSNRLWQPFQETLQQLEAYDIGNPSSINYPDTNIDEFRRMNSVIERLISRNLSVYNTQKEFVENAAHELQTPLAVMRSKLDNLMQEDLSLKEAKTIDALNYSIERLTQLNKNMLLLSRIEYDIYSGQENILLNDVLTRQMDFLSEQLTDVKTELLLIEPLTVNANKSLLEICLSNLLVNAIRHNVKDGYMKVIIENGSIKIINTGKAESLDNGQLFSRFSKQDNSKSGTGLGLAIVKRIVELNHWQIDYKFENNLHIFILKFNQQISQL